MPWLFLEGGVHLYIFFSGETKFRDDVNHSKIMSFYQYSTAIDPMGLDSLLESLPHKKLHPDRDGCFFFATGGLSS